MSKGNLQENFYKRMKHLAGVKSANNTPASLSTSTLIGEYSRSNDGIALGIVKENHNYYIKTSGKQSEQLGAEDFAYIGGVENKFKYQYSTLAEAEKNKNMYIKALNESHLKKFKPIAINESENIGKAQTNADTLNADKAQTEADKGKGNAPLKDTAPEKKPATVPSSKEISVKTQTNPKTVDDTKESNAKAIATNKQTTTKVVKENEELPPFPPSEDGAAVEPSVPSPEATPQGDAPVAAADAGAENSSEDGELDAAAAALDSLGAGSDEPTAADAGAEQPQADTGLGDQAGGEMGTPDADQGGDGEANIKDIEKLTGKVTQKIRSTNLTPELTKGFLKSYITAFEDKLSELDHEDRKELSNAILKDSAEDEMGIGDDTQTTDDAEEKEIEETINAHLAEMGISESDVNIEASAESSDHKPFKDYVKARGYNPERVDEISLMEMVSLVNGYTNECGDTIDKADVQGLAEFVTPEVSEKVQESGNSIFENLMKPFGEKIKNNKKAYATEAVIPSLNENFGEEEEETDDLSSEITSDEDDDTTLVTTDDKPEEEDNDAITIAPAGQTIAAGAPGADASKTVTLDLNNNTISVSMNESIDQKLHKIAQKKIQEQLSGKKSAINENKKSELSKMIDQLVTEAIDKRISVYEKAYEKKMQSK